MTKQDIFNRVCRHLIKQNKLAVGSDGCCVYRTKDSLRCAVGCLIPKKYYKSEIEGVSFDFNPSSQYRPIPDATKALEKLARKLDLYRHRKFIRELQLVHDGNNPEEWIFELNKVAERNKLKSPKCIKI